MWQILPFIVEMVFVVSTAFFLGLDYRQSFSGNNLWQ